MCDVDFQLNKNLYPIHFSQIRRAAKKDSTFLHCAKRARQQKPVEVIFRVFSYSIHPL